MDQKMNYEKIFDINGYVVFITGATGYLGKEITRGLAKKGAKVYINSRNIYKLEKFQKELEEENLKVFTAPFDVGSQEEVENYFRNDFNENHINLLVNNAYTGKSGGMSSTRKDFIESYNVSVASSFSLVKVAENLLEKSVQLGQQSSVVNVASMYGMIAPPFEMYDDEKNFNPPFYGSAKAGLIHLTKYLGCLLAAKKIRVNSISPGPFPNLDAQQNMKLIAGITLKSPMKRIGQPHEIVGPLIFLASEASSYITGANIVIDGGWTASS
jgi:NAD(P)-dependent dehydrogenase (short-subunit alcohol dehydrogenase family)